jgi:hypothetical protein
MPASEQGLSLTASAIKEAADRVVFYEEAWDEEAISCDHSQMGGDGLECSHPKQGEDPFCCSTNCPLIKEA